MKVTELQRLYDETIIARHKSFWITGMDGCGYELPIDYAAYMLEYLHLIGVRTFEIKEGKLDITEFKHNPTKAA